MSTSLGCDSRPGDLRRPGDIDVPKHVQRTLYSAIVLGRQITPHPRPLSGRAETAMCWFHSHECVRDGIVGLAQENLRRRSRFIRIPILREIDYLATLFC